MSQPAQRHASEQQNDLNERLAFFGLDQNARDALRDLKPLLAESVGPALKSFYEKVSATPATRRFFRDAQHMQNAQGHQERHWGLIAEANFDANYADAVRRIGQAHARIGLEPRWYTGGYATVIDQLVRSVIKERWPRPAPLSKHSREDVADSIGSLVKAALLDMDIAISVYLDTLNDQRRVAEEVNETQKREAAAAVAAIGQGLSKLAGHDLRHRIVDNLPETFGKLKSDFNSALDEIETVMQAVAEGTQGIQAGTQEISVAADDLSRRTEHQAASLEETAAALDEITATVQKSAEGANHAREVVTAADDDANKSAAVVKDAVAAMDAIAKSAQQINQIIGVIDEIAFQTNLLALNAGVEAARAGEAGRGFAVVASEVRALAQRSAEAAKEIKTLISASRAEVERGVELVGETGKSLARILAQVGDINMIVGDIATGAREQATGLAQVNTAVNEMDRVTQQNATMVEQTTAASHSLSQEAERLAALIGKFQVSRAREPVRKEPKTLKPALTTAKRTPHASRGTLRAVANGPAAVDADGWEEF